MALVLGLGNPGADYADTRHNAGWWVVERLARRWQVPHAERRPEYRAWTGAYKDRSVSLLEPLTWMNRSGEALEAWRQGHGLELSELLVVADDVYLPAGHLRLRASGSSGGHRGLESLEQVLGTREYARLRFGVGTTAADRLKQHVLERPSESQVDVLERAVEAAADAVEWWVAEGVVAAMNRINRKVSKEVSEP